MERIKKPGLTRKDEMRGKKERATGVYMRVNEDCEQVFNKAGRFSRQSRQLGISLLEVLLSLSIIAIILVMATRYYFVANNNNKINNTVSQVGGILAASQNWKGVETDYTGISIQQLYNAGQLTNYPGLHVNGDTATLSDMWGKPITIAPDSTDAKISVVLPSPNICAALVKAYPQNTNAGITSVCDGSTFNYTFS